MAAYQMRAAQTSSPPMQVVAVEVDQSLLADAAAKRALRQQRAGHWRMPVPAGAPKHHEFVTAQGSATGAAPARGR